MANPGMKLAVSPRDMKHKEAMGAAFLSIGRILAGCALVLGSALAAAQDVTVIGLMAGRAVVVIDGGKQRTMRVGEVTPEGVKLLDATSDSATVEVKGRRQTLALGSHATVARSQPSGNASVAVVADSRGHFVTGGTVNGMPLRFLVDTGASVVALSTDDAKRAGVNYLAGSRGQVQTANGPATVYMVKLDSLQIGDITLHNVDAAVIEGEKLPISLLGMSFLNRMEMKRSGDTLTLIRRY